MKIYNKKRSIILMAAAAVVVCTIVIGIIVSKNRTSSDYGNINSEEYAVPGMVNTDKVCYFVNKGKISVFDKNTMKTMVLCGNSRCSHDNGGCNGAVDSPEMVANSLSYYDGALYYIGMASGQIEVTQCSMDGSSKEKVVSVFEIADGENATFTDFAFIALNGYGYFTVTELNSQTLDNRYARLYRIKLDKDGTPELVTSIENINCMIKLCGKAGDKIYYSVKYTQEESSSTSYFEFDTSSKENKKIISADVMGTIVQLNDSLYYNTETEIYRIDLDGSNEQKICDTGNLSGICAVGEYLVLVKQQESQKYSVELMNTNGEIVSSGDIGYECLTLSCMGGNTDVFFQIMSYDDDKTVYFNVDKAVQDKKISFKDVEG